MLLFILSNVSSIYAVLAMRSTLVITCHLAMMLVTISPYLWRIVTIVVHYNAFVAVTFNAMPFIWLVTLRSIHHVRRLFNENAIENFLYISGENSLALSWKKSYTSVGKYAPHFQITRFTPHARPADALKIHRRA